MRIAVHLAVNARHPGVGDAGRTRNGAAACSIRTSPRPDNDPGRHDADQATARLGRRQSRAEPRPGVRREAGASSTRRTTTRRSRSPPSGWRRSIRRRCTRSTATGSRTPPTSRSSWSARSRSRRRFRCSRATSDRCPRPDGGCRSSRTSASDSRLPSSARPSSRDANRCAQTVISFAADVPPDAIEQEKMIAATMVVENTLRDVLREDLGQTYSVGVGLSQAAAAARRRARRGELRRRAAEHSVDVRSCAAGGAAAAAAGTVGRARRERPRRPHARSYETSMRENGYWMGRLQRIHLIGADPSEILTRPQRIDSHDAGHRAGHTQEILPARSLHDGDAAPEGTNAAAAR